MSDRLVFPQGKQREFMLAARHALGLNWAEVALLIDAHPKSVRDWAREKHSISQEAAHLLAQLSGIKIPIAAKKLVWKDHLRSAGQEGWRQMRDKYGVQYRIPINEQYRKQKWHEWWQTKGKYLPTRIHNTPLSFKKPPLSEELAEFVGILLGDGGISRYQLVVTLHRYDDAAYSLFVRKLIFDLFRVVPGTHVHRDAMADNIVISRIGLVNYCVHELGLKIGNKVKQQVDIPAWIKRDQKLLVACIRGLVDTDGCIFIHRYTAKEKEYSYKKLSFASASIPLRLTVYDTLRKLGIYARLASKGKMRGVSEVRIDSKEGVSNYFEKVGSHNPKHLKRYYS